MITNETFNEMNLKIDHISRFVEWMDVLTCKDLCFYKKYIFIQDTLNHYNSRKFFFGSIEEISDERYKIQGIRKDSHFFDGKIRDVYVYVVDRCESIDFNDYEENVSDQ